MTEQPPQGPAQQQPAYQDPAYQQQAQQAVEDVQASPGVDAGTSIDQMEAVRAQLTDFEKRLQAQMQQAQEQAANQNAQIDALMKQLASARAAAGPPELETLAASAAQRVQSIATANPDLGAQHFAGVISQASNLADEASNLANGRDGASADKVHSLLNSVGTWLTRTHARTSGKVLEGAGALMEELERISEAV